jgi:hypothetical protein
MGVTEPSSRQRIAFGAVSTAGSVSQTWRFVVGGSARHLRSPSSCGGKVDTLMIARLESTDGLVFHERLEPIATRRMLKLAQRLGPQFAGFARGCASGAASPASPSVKPDQIQLTDAVFAPNRWPSGREGWMLRSAAPNQNPTDGEHSASGCPKHAEDQRNRHSLTGSH